MKNLDPKKLQGYLETATIFTGVLLATILFASIWAKMFFGSWFAISFQNELPNILIFSSVATALVVVWRSRVSGKARLQLLIGLSLIALDILFELPLKKYVALVPATPIGHWFFFFGMTKFIGIMLVLAGVTALLRELRKES